MDLILLLIFLILLMWQRNYLSKKYLTDGAIIALQAMEAELKKVVIHVKISHVDGIFYCHDNQDNFLYQYDTLEELMSKLKSTNKTCLLFKGRIDEGR